MSTSTTASPNGRVGRKRAQELGLAAVDALLARNVSEEKEDVVEENAPVALRQESNLTPVTFASMAQSRFQRSIARAERGEPGGIRISDLVLDDGLVKYVEGNGLVASYRKLLELNPHVQPGTPLVNIQGNSDEGLNFRLLTLYELVVASRELGRETVQVLLVRVPESEAEQIRLSSMKDQVVPPVNISSPLEVAGIQGFMELSLNEIRRDENFRSIIDRNTPEFRNLVESIRILGLQNPPVVEVRKSPLTALGYELVCTSGHRRLAALDELGLSKITCSLRQFTTGRHRTLATLAENINRQDFQFLEKADGYGDLHRKGMTAHEIAAILDTDERTIRKYLRASTWPDVVKNRIRTLGSKLSIRFLLNRLAATERDEEELTRLIDEHLGLGTMPKEKAPAGDYKMRQKLSEFYAMVGFNDTQKKDVERVLQYLGIIG
jgi:ParB/RepB/Spo0J family partition protein